jgi:hypothetical protein
MATAPKVLEFETLGTHTPDRKEPLHLSLPGCGKVPAWAFAAGIAGIFLGFVLLAKLTGNWQTHLTDEVYFQLVPRVQDFVHPGMWFQFSAGPKISAAV